MSSNKLSTCYPIVYRVSLKGGSQVYEWHLLFIYVLAVALGGCVAGVKATPTRSTANATLELSCSDTLYRGHLYSAQTQPEPGRPV